MGNEFQGMGIDVNESSYHTEVILMMMMMMMMTRYAPVDGGDQRHGYNDERE